MSSKAKHSLLSAILSTALLLVHSLPALSQASSPQVVLLNTRGLPIDHLTDGDEIRLRITLPQSVNQPMQVSFSLVGSGTPLGECNLERGQDRCDSQPFAALGWYWDAGGSPVRQRAVQAKAGGSSLAVSDPLPVSPRPVVMVHGFNSSWVAWENYLGPDGYLAQLGIQGYAVGDGQVEGTMNTGRLEQPNGKTNTIAQNAAILAEYIANVRKHTGAQKVDLLVHSMGGLISRYYIDRLMGENEVAQLIMLGSPMAGSDCANLPSALGFYLPAALEIRPNYVQGVFNQQITHRHGIAFHALAGVPILEAIKSPCTPIPTDLVVSRQSVGAIPLHISEMSILHIELNTSAQVFDEYVRPLLQTSAGNFAYEPDPPLAPPGLEQQQFTRTFTGHVTQGSSQELTIPIDADVAVASFALFDPTRSLNVSVRGASGNVIELDPAKNGLTIVDDPEALFYLGYGFNNPKPGAWKVTLISSEKTPAGGADFALSASFQGGARLEAQVSQLLPRLDEAVQFSARLVKGGQSLDIDQAQTNVRSPDGNLESLAMSQVEGERQVMWTPRQPGLYSVEISVSGHTPDGMAVERAAYFTVEAQPAPRSPLLSWGILCAVMIVILAINLWVFAILVKKARRRKNPNLP